MNLLPLLSEAEIAAEVRRLAAEISADYAGRRPVLIGVLTGAFVFLADLLRALTIPAEVAFVRAASYGERMESSGAVQVTALGGGDLRGRDVILVEDILDTGRTLQALTAWGRAQEPASLRCCALLVREGQPAPAYLGRRVGPGFVVGYGIDYAGAYRGLRDIRIVAGS